MLAAVDEQIIRLAVACKVKNHLSFSRKIKPYRTFTHRTTKNTNQTILRTYYVIHKIIMFQKLIESTIIFAFFISLILCIKQYSF